MILSCYLSNNIPIDITFFLLKWIKTLIGLSLRIWSTWTEPWIKQPRILSPQICNTKMIPFLFPERFCVLCLKYIETNPKWNKNHRYVIIDPNKLTENLFFYFTETLSEAPELRKNDASQLLWISQLPFSERLKLLQYKMLFFMRVKSMNIFRLVFHIELLMFCSCF